MSIDWQASRVQVVVSSSMVMTEEWCDEVFAQWDGPIERHHDPERLQEMLLDADTPSLFSQPALLSIKVSESYWKRHAKLLAPLCGVPAVAGVVVVQAQRLLASDPVAKAAQACGALHRLQVPRRAHEVQTWLIGRLHQMPEGVERPQAVADALMQHRGEDLDGLLAALNQVRAYVDGPVTSDDVHDAIGGSAERPAWEYTDHLLSGRLPAALATMYAGRGLEADHILAALANDLRRCLCALAEDDDKQAAQLAGARQAGAMHHARRRGRTLHQRGCERLLNGVLQTMRASRHGDDPELASELFSLHAQRVIRP
ncbi:MAG: hypothetical protein EA401_04000 [Planctomycetota bacterium]|nr:MAG: hypothetical protein EA401_04000 [Planctomycetota bacterium]